MMFIMIIALSVLTIVFLQNKFKFNHLSKKTIIDKYVIAKSVKDDQIYCEILYLNKNSISLKEIERFYYANYVKIESVENRIVYYYLSPILKEKIELKNGSFNLQIVDDGNDYIVAYPINYSSF